MLGESEIRHARWDKFAASHANGCAYQLSAWAAAIARSYSHSAEQLVATDTRGSTSVRLSRVDEAGPEANRSEDDILLGILPLVHVRHWLFGNSLVSMPYCDAGGVLAVDRNSERLLVERALRLADERGIRVLELRQYYPLACIDDRDFSSDAASPDQHEVLAVPGWHASRTSKNKVRMLLALPESPDELMQSFKAKLRSQIRKPIKDGLTVKIGGIDLLDDFYDVFAINMRDLGSPVHSKQFVQQVVLGFPGKTNIFLVYGKGEPMACSLTLGFNRILSNPWASSLRRHAAFAPNMLLYWSMLEHACRNGYQTFDFGRSTVDEGTYRFKEQWGAKPAPLYWYKFSRNGGAIDEASPNGGWLARASECWKRLPVPLTRVLGPKIRPYISL
jgi:FemAB-related protein (PEP-CTERM system-associated)